MRQAPGFEFASRLLSRDGRRAHPPKFEVLLGAISSLQTNR